MGIRTKFTPMGGGNEESRVPIPNAWSYTTRINEKGKEVRTLYFYNNAIGGDEVKVPYGYTELQDYRGSTNYVYASLPFYNHTTLTNVDLKKVPFKNNNMADAFFSCQNLTSVKGINKNVTNMSRTFYSCQNLNQNIQIPNSVTSMSNTFSYCSKLNQNIQIPNSVTNMWRTFDSCYNLNQNIQIPNSVTSMGYTFQGCSNLNQNIQIPNSVTNMGDTFQSCSNLNQNIQIPNSVTSMGYTFQGCSNLNQNIQIPNSVTSMRQTFMGCANLNQNIQIPNSVTNMWGTFQGCRNLNQNIRIPNSVTNMWGTFQGCRNLNQNIRIPNSVTDMESTFYDCYNLGTYHKTINILGEEVSNTINTFHNTSYYNASNQLTIVFPLRYINNVNTLTRNSLVTAGYAVGAGTGVTAANATANYNLKCFDWIAGDWNTYTGNGTHWALAKWNGALTAHFNNGVAPIDLTFPNKLTSYATFPTVINISTYTDNTVINSIKVTEDIPWVSNRTGWYTNVKSRGGAFQACTNLKRADVWVNDSVLGMNLMFWKCANLQHLNIHISNSATSLHGLVTECTNLYSANTGTSFKARTFDVNIPDTVTNVQSMFSNCKELSNIYLKGKGITVLTACFDYCNTRDMNIHIDSPVVANIVNVHRGYNASFKKNYYIPYMYANGTYTKTYATLNAQAVMRNNATSNFYMYDSSPYNSVADYVVTWNATSSSLYLNTYRGQNTVVNVVNESPFGGDVYMVNSVFYNNKAITEIDCNNVPLTPSTIATFRYSSALTHINNLNVPNSVAANCYVMFDGCTSLRHAPYSPSGPNTTTAAYMYGGCTNMGLDAPVNIVFGPAVVNYRETFNGCTNLTGDVYFLCPSSSTSDNKWNRTFTGKNTSRRLNLHCYYKYSNGTYTATYNILKAAAYTGTSGNAAGTSPMYNSTSNYYVYDITQDVQQAKAEYTTTSGTYNGSSVTVLNKYTGTHTRLNLGVLSFPSYPGATSTTKYAIGVGCYSEKGIISVDLVNTPFVDNNMNSVFKLCQNLKEVKGINENVTNMGSAFWGCSNFNQNIQIPNSVTSMSYTFYWCFNLNQNIQIPNSVTNLWKTFDGCTNLTGSITVESTEVENADYCFYNTSKAKTVYIPFKYSSGDYTNTYNAFYNAGYTEGLHGVTLHDLGVQEGGCNSK